MFRTVFARMLATFIAVVAVITSLQIVMLSTLFLARWRDNQEKSLITATEELASLAAVAIQSGGMPGNGPTEALLSGVLERSMAFAAMRYEADVWLVTPAGNCFCLTVPPQSDGSLSVECVQKTTMNLQRDVREYYLQPVLEGTPIAVEGYFGNTFAQQRLSVGYPVQAYGQVVGAMFIHSGQSYLATMNRSLMQQSAISALLAMAVGVLLVLWTSRTLTNPLKQMSEAAAGIARGDFRKKVTVQTEDEIGELAYSFNKMAEELEQQENLRKDFVANVSHELRSPLTSMQGFAQGMLDGTIPHEEHEKYLGVIVSETRRLSKLIRELLDLSQIESGLFPLNKQVFNINETVLRSVVKFEERIESAGLQVSIDLADGRIPVLADPDRIEQVLTNLIDNAVKYTRPGGTITLTSQCVGDKVYVGVKDNGNGIPEEDLPNIWERFYKAEKSHSTKNSTGLGLSIVKKIIEQHGERITVKSQSGQGCVFVFTLPLAQEGEKNLPAPPAGK